MLHPFHLVIDSFSLFGLKQPQMQVSSNIDLKRECVVRIDAKQF
jgi:hypothetical protein